MPKVTYQETITLTTIDCPSCGVMFGLTDELIGRLRTNGKTFYCPNGHSQWYGESEADKVKKELEAAQRKIAMKDFELATERSSRELLKRELTATKGQLTKVKNRVAKGVCPCCNRHFTNLERHMTTQHPGYDAPEVEAE